MMDTRETAYKINATDSKPTEKRVIGRHIDVKAIRTGCRTVWWSTALFKLVSIYRVCTELKVMF
jgi:hypothetical protein